MRRLVVLTVVALVVVFVACKEKPQPAETQSSGNATDRDPVTGTSGTGEPGKVSTDSAASATALGTAPTTGTGALAVTGTEEVHGAKTETTSTIVAATTTTSSVATPTDTTSTIQTPTGTKTTVKKKH
jgi:hypothetical protein